MAQPLDKMSVFNTGPSQNTLAIDGLQQAMRALHHTVDVMAQELKNAKRETLEVRAQLEKYETRQDVQATVHGLDKRIKGLEDEQYMAERSYNFLWPANKVGTRFNHDSVAYKLEHIHELIRRLTVHSYQVDDSIELSKRNVLSLAERVEEQLGQHNAVIETVPALEQRLAKLEQAVHKFEANTSAKPLYSVPHDDEYEALKRSLEQFKKHTEDQFDDDEELHQIIQEKIVKIEAVLWPSKHIDGDPVPVMQESLLERLNRIEMLVKRLS
jgi:hypothetical protein